ncbi:hypothetical protein FRC12_005856 [Ceratobasidium sp. 428]|nr:hypothetical protein FRC12_005856 [Ceratobasidium sp. 428]
MLCVGLVPGPTEPKDVNSFLQPQIDELEAFAYGVPAYNTLHLQPFELRAYLLACFGNMPAVSKLMAMTGHTGKLHYHACKIEGFRPMRYGQVDPKKRHHYIPLSRPFAPRNKTRKYDPFDLPLRSHAEFIEQARHVQDAPNNTQETDRARDCGIHFIPPLARLSSIELPGSFPHDFMHIIFQNIIPDLIMLWTQTERYKATDTGDEQYDLNEELWQDIGLSCKQSGDTMPAAFGCRVPDLSEDETWVTAEAKLVFSTLLAPSSLHRRFKQPQY